VWKKPAIACVYLVIVSALVLQWRVDPAYGQQLGQLVCGAAAQHNFDDLGTVIPNGLNDPRLGTAFQLDYDALHGLLRVNTPVKVINEKTGANAFALPPSQDTPDGVVYLGRKLIDGEFRDGTPWAISAVLGHEFCHIIQVREQCPWQDKRRELLADFWAGWFFARRDHAFRKESM
jgi:hypothetical protein